MKTLKLKTLKTKTPQSKTPKSKTPKSRTPKSKYSSKIPEQYFARILPNLGKYIASNRTIILLEVIRQYLSHPLFSVRTGLLLHYKEHSRNGIFSRFKTSIRILQLLSLQSLKSKLIWQILNCITLETLVEYDVWGISYIVAIDTHWKPWVIYSHFFYYSVNEFRPWISSHSRFCTTHCIILAEIPHF